MFDIDKLGLSTINWNVNGRSVSDRFKKGTKEAYQNQLIRDFITLLIDPKSAHILHRSIDNDTSLLTDIVEEIQPKGSDIEVPYGFYSLSTQTTRKDDYITGKIGIGPFALNNNNHILTMLYDVRFKTNPNSIMTKLGLNNLGCVEDKDHNSVMSWISALINAHVDIAKDPYISKLNVNPYTYNVVNTLIRTGFGKDTFYFTTQPIMKELAKAYMNAASAYMADKNKDKYTIQKEAVENVLQGRFGDETINGHSFEEIMDQEDPMNVGRRAEIADIFKQLVADGVLKKNANKSFTEISGATVSVGKNQIKLTANQVQFVVALANMQFEPYALSVSNLVKYSKIDTKKHGKSYIEQSVYQDGYRDLFFGEDGLFEPEGLKRMAKDSYIQTKTENAISTTKAILNGQFLQATNAFDKATEDMLTMIGKPASSSVDLRSKIAKILMAMVKSQFINQYAKDLHPNNPNFIHDLVSESSEEFTGTSVANNNYIMLNESSNYDLRSYIGGTATFTFNGAKSDAMRIGMDLGSGGTVINIVQNDKDATYTFRYPIIGVKDNSIITPMVRRVDGIYTSVILDGGRNTIYDRLLNLAVQFKNNPEYSDILDVSGEPYNVLLRNLVKGETFSYKPTGTQKESPDTYKTLKFIKLFNALDQNGLESNHIIDGWDELLHDNKHEKLKEFAEDLVIYAFVTSGDQGGFTKFFKQVPFSWRKESGYGDFIDQKLEEFQSQEISKSDLEDAMLNNWFDNQIIPTRYLYYYEDKKKYPNFIAYSGEYKGTQTVGYPLLLAALKYDTKSGNLTPTMKGNFPTFIKIPREGADMAGDTQRRYTVYHLMDYGMMQDQFGVWIQYPIYSKTNPKGNQIKNDYLMTEYGRDDSAVHERSANTDNLSKMYKIGDFLSRQTIEEYRDKFGKNFADIMEHLNNRAMFELYGEDMDRFTEGVLNRENVKSDDTLDNNKSVEAVVNKESQTVFQGPYMQNATDILKQIVNNNKVSKITKNVAEKYISIFEKYPITIEFTDFGDRGQWYSQFNKTQKSFTENITIPKSLIQNSGIQYASEYVLHELTHAATSISINTNQDIENAFNNVIDYVKGVVEQVSEIGKS